MTIGARGILATVVTLAFQFAAAEVPSGYVAVAQSERVPADILYAVACAESGRRMPDGQTLPWPWSLNVGGEARYFASRAAAHLELTRVLRQSANVDIGLGQVNWYWHKQRFADAWDALDPYTNLQVAARYLREQFDRCECNDWWVAVERYHAPSDTRTAEKRRSRYRGNVERCWKSNTD